MNSKKSENNSSRHLELARELAREKLKALDLADVAGKAGGAFHEGDNGFGTVQIEYLGKPVHVAQPHMTLSFEPGDWEHLGGPVKLHEEIFILHYLVRATGKLPTGNLIPFRQMDGGMVYESVFRGRTVLRIIDAFRDREEFLRDIGGILGGTPEQLGNVSLRLKVLPHIDLAVVLWKGDDEIPSSGNILFDESVMDYLPTEDCTVMAEAVTGRLIRILNQNIDKKSASTTGGMTR